MRHYHIKDDNSGDHYAVGTTGHREVLLQVQENGEQVRIKLTLEQAECVVELLQTQISKAKSQDSLEDAIKKYQEQKCKKK